MLVHGTLSPAYTQLGSFHLPWSIRLPQPGDPGMSQKGFCWSLETPREHPTRSLKEPVQAVSKTGNSGPCAGQTPRARTCNSPKSSGTPSEGRAQAYLLAIGSRRRKCLGTSCIKSSRLSSAQVFHFPQGHLELRGRLMWCAGKCSVQCCSSVH